MLRLARFKIAAIRVFARTHHDGGRELYTVGLFHRRYFLGIPWWQLLDDFTNTEEAKKAYEAIKDLPQYLA